QLAGAVAEGKPDDRRGARDAARGHAALPLDGGAGRPVRAPLPPPRPGRSREHPRSLRARIPRGPPDQAARAALWPTVGTGAVDGTAADPPPGPAGGVPARGATAGADRSQRG